MADEVEVRLSRMRRAMAKMAAEGREREFEALDKAYQVLARERDEGEQARLRAERVRVRRVAVRPSAGSGRWRLPSGFGRSPGAVERDRQGPAAVAAQVPAGGLRPWRRGSLMETRVWRP